jgi:hypothetical protein
MSTISSMSPQTDVARRLMRDDRNPGPRSDDRLRRLRAARLEINGRLPDGPGRFAHLKRTYD